MNIRPSLISAAMIFLLWPGPWLAAQEPGFQPANLEALVVTADRFSEARREVTSNISVIDGAVIENSSARDLGDLLAQQGFQVRKYPGSLSNLGLRGFRTDSHGNDLTSHVLILLNGRRIGTGNLAKISTLNIERVEVIRGPAAVQYGSAAMGGVVNVITKKGSGPLTAALEAGAGSYGAFKTELSWGGSEGAFDFSGAYGFFTINDYSTGRGNRYRHTREDARNAVFLDFGYNFLERHRLGVGLNYFNANDALSPGPWGDPSYSVTDKSNHALDLTYTGSTGDGRWSWLGRYSFGEDKNTTFTPDYASLGYEPFYRNKVKSRNAQAQVSYDQGLFRLTGGLDMVNYDLTDAYAPYRSEYENLAGFLLGKLRLFDERLIISAGGRYDYFKAKLKDGSGGGENCDHFSPSVGLAFLPAVWLKLRANYAQAFVSPEARQLASDFISGGLHYKGNPNLKPETSDTWEAGFDISWRQVDLSFTYFYTKTKDFINAEARPGQIVTYVNIGQARREGLELELSADLGALLARPFELRPYANFNYMTKYKDKDTGEKIHYIPDWTVGYGLRFRHPEHNLSASLAFSYFGEEIAQDWSNMWTPVEVRHGRFTVADLAVGKRIMDFGGQGHVDLKVEINNLFDKYYEPVYSYPGPGRNFYGGLVYVF